MNRLHPEIRLLLFYLDQAFGRRGWHGPTLSAAVRNLPVTAALWRPAPGRHNIWELVLHAAYWKFAVRRRLARHRASRFSRPGANWPRLPSEPGARQWETDITLLKDEHRRLLEVVRGFPPARLHTRIPGMRFIPVEQIQGIAAHDLYHCGQISLIRRLHDSEK